MADYIERERARFEFERFFKGNETVQHDCDSLLCMFPAADVAPVVRCKDCKHRGKLYRNHLCDHPKAILSRITDTDFCSYGERREEDG